jgi:hypothetical protein
MESGLSDVENGGSQRGCILRKLGAGARELTEESRGEFSNFLLKMLIVYAVPTCKIVQ